eukprot:GHRQ01011675.1.p1 GENE.GHRQ01011675.1~~GHRQ01011675.1.p1  ORF type:complete len:336 (+),score=76.60 GHRQ01011675.1:682-1689(+)
MRCLLTSPSSFCTHPGPVGVGSIVPRGVLRSRSSRPQQRIHASRDAPSSNGKGLDEDTIWSQLAFPSYLQSSKSHKKGVCDDFDKALAAAERKQAADCSIEDLEEEDPAEAVWLAIRREAERDAATEPLLSSFLYATILAHDSFERALAFVLSNRLANTVMLPTQLFETFYEVLVSDADVRQGALADVEACRERVSTMRELGGGCQQLRALGQVVVNLTGAAVNLAGAASILCRAVVSLAGAVNILAGAVSSCSSCSSCSRAAAVAAAGNVGGRRAPVEEPSCRSGHSRSLRDCSRSTCSYAGMCSWKQSIGDRHMRELCSDRLVKVRRSCQLKC